MLATPSLPADRDRLPNTGPADALDSSCARTCLVGSGVALVRADASSYCLQTTADPTAVMHDAGPNGTVEPGPC